MGRAADGRAIERVRRRCGRTQPWCRRVRWCCGRTGRCRSRGVHRETSLVLGAGWVVGPKPFPEDEDAYVRGTSGD
ncbi:hypothetical protein [Streptomyces afghaniensis]|uniref:hypothetical protein n=1 Tax=Streptomyces afghaniensis TaxID=66865 RepID=UPI000FE22F87|nr:hypothetical protein [Streptomyces afghaniensis]